ncbi:hypothetical protein [Caulobacter sp. 602-1]|uniref:hypothetical protein n=1 Tax=unclassified Caulobacter TaxID=2648921 RepID=UPI000F6427B7|nr:hypothetical protein [Caulobacter sp. 602-1]RRN66448.1 hypothetical protein EIK80_03970 [Caulobacter sp. 602-1]
MVEPFISRPGKAARNEQRKALAATCNATAIAFLGSSLLQPLVSGHSNLLLVAGALLAFVALQGALHYILFRVED